MGLLPQAEHWRVMRSQDFAIADVHMYAARQAGIEAANGPHDVDAFELVRTILLKDRCVLDGVLVWTSRPVDIARACIPRGRRIRMIVCDLPFLDHHVMGKDSAYRFVESTGDSLV